MFPLYKCKVRLAGSLINEVPKEGVTAPEIFIMRALHGGEDMVIDVKRMAKDALVDELDDEGHSHKRPRTEAEERERLNELYGPALRGMEDLKSVNGVFGVATPLPKTVPGAESEPGVNRFKKKQPADDSLAELAAA